MTNKEAFKQFLFIVPTPISAGQKDVKLRWEFKDLKPDQINHIHPSCGCTAKVEIQNDAIVASFSDQTKQDVVDKDPNGIVHIQKHLTVYLNDENELKIIGPKGLIFNPLKKKLKIIFAAYVV